MLEFLTLQEQITVANRSFMDFYLTRRATGVKVVWIRKKKEGQYIILFLDVYPKFIVVKIKTVALGGEKK